MEGRDVAPVSTRLELAWYVYTVRRVVFDTARGLEDSLGIKHGTHTYLFLLITRLGPPACSGGAAVFFLAIGPNERLVAREEKRMNVGR